MSKLTSALVLSVAAGFLAIGLFALFKGNYRGAGAGLFFFALVAFIGGVGWFELKFPLPTLPSGSRPNLVSEAKRYLVHYPNWPGKLAAFVLVAIALIGVVSLLAGILR